MNKATNCISCVNNENFSCIGKQCVPGVKLIKTYHLAEEIYSIIGERYTVDEIASILVEFFYDAHSTSNEIVGCGNCEYQEKSFVCNHEICSSHYIFLLKKRLDRLNTNIELI